MVNSKIKFILASASPRRKELIGHLKVPFEIMTLNVPEESDHADPLDKSPEATFFVVSADTIVCLNGKIFNKPRDRDEARLFLNELSGKSHSVFTAVTINLAHEGKTSSHSFVEESKVTFNKISHALMERYLDTGDSLDKAGAYGIQGPSLTFISKVEGDYANVVGFPLSRFVLESEKYLKEKFPKEYLWLNLF